MQRARQTAAPLAEAHGLTVQPLDELKEVCFGEWEGLSYDEIKAKWSDQLELFFKQPAQCRMPGGESFDDVALRVVALAIDLLSIQWGHHFVNKFFVIFVKILYAIKTIIDDEHIFNMRLQRGYKV